MEYKIVSLAVALLVVAVCLAGIQGCSDFEPHIRSPAHDESLEQKVYYSEYVVFGKAGRVRKGDKFPYSDLNGVRTIEFEVLCSYKEMGEPVARFIYVAGVGNKNGQLPGCPAASLKEGQTAIMYLRKLPPSDSVMENTYEVEYTPLSNPAFDDSQKLDELTISCGIKRKYPKGADNDSVCTEEVGEPYCSVYTPATPKPDIVTEKATEAKPKMTTPTSMKPKPTTDANPTKGGNKNPGTKIENEKNDTYDTKKTAGSSDPNGGATVKTLSQGLVVLISVIFILV